MTDPASDLPDDLLAPDLHEMLAAVRILSDRRFSVGREVFEVKDPEDDATREDGAQEDGAQKDTAPEVAAPEDVDLALPPHLWRRVGDGSEVPVRVRALESVLYQRLYTRAGTALSRSSDPVHQRGFASRLSAANHGQGTWNPGWLVQDREEDGTLHVVQSHLIFRARPEWVRTDGSTASPGDRCRVWIEKEMTAVLPGFYLALGDAESAEAPAQNGPIVRLYWHLTAAGAAPFLDALTTRFNAAEIAFRCKVLRDPGTYDRADAGVLYLDPEAIEKAWTELGPLYGEVADELRSTVPRCTFELAPGLGVAEDPGNGQSFGQHRCRLVARALWQAFDQGTESPHRRAELLAAELRRAELLAAELRRAELDPLRPHLGPGSSKVYPPLALDPPTADKLAVPRGAVPRGAVPRGAVSRGNDTDHPPSFLEAAVRIGDLLRRSAYRHAGRCNWVGHSGRGSEADSGQPTPTVLALGPTFYEGTAGVGWFLARLYGATERSTEGATGEMATDRTAPDEPDLRETAVGALRQALWALDAVPGFSLDASLASLGVYSGRLGVLWAVHRAGEVLGAAELVEPAERDLVELVESLLESLDDEGDHDLDVISGCAGAIPALLALHRQTAHEPFLQAAIRLGEELCETAVQQRTGWAWDPERVDRKIAVLPAPALDRPWTGLSHGAAGMGLGLFELYAATGRDDFLDKAVGAFAYEDSLLDREAGGWQDTRSSRTPRYSTFWCHGAPGIVLARLRAAELHPDVAEGSVESARLGLATTRSALEEGLKSSEADTSLCHGLCGLAEVLLVAARSLGDEGYEATAREALARLLELHGTDEPWPSGVPSRGSNPSLMLGMAGVGYTLLRLHDPEMTPSVLWVGAGSAPPRTEPAG